MRFIKTNKFFSILFGTVTVLGLLKTLELSVFVRYWADDFCAGAVQRVYGFWDSQIYWYQNWSGRYSYNFFLQLFTLFKEDFVKIWPVILFVMLIIGVGLLFSQIAKERKTIIIPSTFFALIVIINSPNIIQTFYWQVGSIVYALPFVFLNIYFYLLLKVVLDNKSALSRLTVILSFLMTFIAGGFSETLSVAGLVFLIVVAALINVFKALNEGVKKIIAAGVIGHILSLFIIYASPGAHLRAQNVDRPESAWFIVEKTARGTAWFLKSLLTSPIFLVSVSLIFFVAFYVIKNREKLKIKISKDNYPKVFFLLLFLPVLTTSSIFFVSFMYTAYLPPQRALFIAVYFIFIELLLFCTTAILFLRFNKPKEFKKMERISNILLLILALLFLGLLNSRLSLAKSEIKLYSQKWDMERQKIIEQINRGDDQIRIKNIGFVGGLDGFSENEGWVAQCIKDYYGISRIEVTN